MTSLDQTIQNFPMQGCIKCNSKIYDKRLEFIDMHSKASSLNIKTVKDIHIMASGSSSYIPIVKCLLKKNKSQTQLLIYINFLDLITILKD